MDLEAYLYSRKHQKEISHRLKVFKKQKYKTIRRNYKIINFLEENIGENLWSGRLPWVRQISYKGSHFLQGSYKKIDKLELIKIKNFYSSNDTVTK